jgi:hypothetical protein
VFGWRCGEFAALVAAPHRTHPKTGKVYTLADGSLSFSKPPFIPDFILIAVSTVFCVVVVVWSAVIVPVIGSIMILCCPTYAMFCLLVCGCVAALALELPVLRCALSWAISPHWGWYLVLVHIIVFLFLPREGIG